jgi:hypothetical protein
MKTTELNAVRELSAMELDQVSGGCGMGPGCNCSGSSAYPSDDGTLLFSEACDGTLYITHIGPPSPVRMI